MLQSLPNSLLLPLTARSEGAPPCNQIDDHPKSFLSRIWPRVSRTVYLLSILTPYWLFNIAAIKQVSTPYFFEDKDLPPSVVGWTLLSLYTLHSTARTSVFYYYRLAGQENGFDSLNTFIRKIPSQKKLGSIILTAVMISIASYVALALGNNEETIISITAILRQLKITSNHENTSIENPSQELAPSYIQLICYLFAILSGNITLANLKIILDSTDPEIRQRITQYLTWQFKRQNHSTTVYTVYFLFYLAILFENSKNIALTLSSQLKVEQHTGPLIACYLIGLIPAIGNMAYDFFKYFMVAECLYAKDDLITYLKEHPQLTIDLFSILSLHDDPHQAVDEENFTVTYTSVRAGRLATDIRVEITCGARTHKINLSELIDLIQSIQNKNNPQTIITVAGTKKKICHPQIILKCLAAVYSAITSLIVSIWITQTRGSGQLYIIIISCISTFISIANNITTFRLDREGLAKLDLLIKNSPFVPQDLEQLSPSSLSLHSSNIFTSPTSSPLRQRINTTPPASPLQHSNGSSEDNEQASSDCPSLHSSDSFTSLPSSPLRQRINIASPASRLKHSNGSPLGRLPSPKGAIPESNQCYYLDQENRSSVN